MARTTLHFQELMGSQDVELLLGEVVDPLGASYRLRSEQHEKQKQAVDKRPNVDSLYRSGWYILM